MPWTVPEEDTEAARQRWCPSGTLGVFVGRLEWEKGIHTLLDALPLVATTDLHMVIAGTGTYESKLLEKAAPHSRRNVSRLPVGSPNPNFGHRNPRRM